MFWINCVSILGKRSWTKPSSWLNQPIDYCIILQFTGSGVLMAWSAKLTTFIEYIWLFFEQMFHFVQLYQVKKIIKGNNLI